MNAKWIGANPANFAVGRAGFPPEAIVIHIMDGSLVGTDSWFNDPKSTVSAHYGVGRGGQVHQYVRETDAAYHAGTVVAPRWKLIKPSTRKPGYINPNLYTIGIEHEGRGLSTDQWPDTMRAASLSLTADVAKRWKIPIDADHIIPHCDIRSTKPNCPGRGIDLITYIAELATMSGDAAPAPAEEKLKLTARVVRAAYVRPEPHTQGVFLRKALPGDSFAAVAVVQGEAVSGNANWFINAKDEFLWAGNTDQPEPSAGA